MIWELLPQQGESRGRGGHNSGLRSPHAAPLFYALFTVSFWSDIVTVLVSKSCVI